MTSTIEGQMHPDRTSTTRFPVPVDAALRAAGWQPGRWDIKQAEIWADALRDHTSPAGHRHAVFPAAVEAWAEFGGLHITPTGPGAANGVPGTASTLPRPTSRPGTSAKAVTRTTESINYQSTRTSADPSL